MNEFQRMIVEDHSLACPKCLGNGWLGGRITQTIPRMGLVCTDNGRECEACQGSGISTDKGV